MVFEFLQAVPDNFLNFTENLSNQSLGKKIIKHTETEFPNLEEIDIALIFVNENRGDERDNFLCDFENIRTEIYKLFPGNWNKSIADLGTLEAGNDLNDSYFALKEIVAELLKKKIIPIVIGGSQDLTYALYRAYDKSEQTVNLITIDSKFDFYNDTKKNSEGYLSKIVLEEPNNLFNYSNIGYQTYYNSQEEVDLIEKLYFDGYRLGEIIGNIKVAEPIFRDADLVSFDMRAIQSHVSGNNHENIPNGFDGREICSISRYCGISDKISSLGIFNHYYSEKEGSLIAQIIWYFIEGIHLRTYEYPFESKDKYLKYTVLAEEQEITFYKSNRSERWWMEINFQKAHNNNLKSTLLPCSYDDYLTACEEEIPERWWKAIRKTHL
jgi:arginase family enzyme